MKDVDLKKLGTLRLCGGGALVALATWGVWAFCSGGFSASRGWESAFDGWRYGREDQKAASAALVAAGLDEGSWDDGRLLVPKNKKNEYQTALAEAGAYPKAPSESRRDAIREMGAFESEAKIRMRELDANAFQLEQTLERIDGIEYATVGVRERREQAGLTAKTVVTASIGVACREGRELDANLLSAITVAAKHHLGVDANENVSILDLKVGKSYFGSENLVGNGIELSLAAEKERVENYWRDKLLKTFDYMGGVRVSVAAELAVVGPNDVVPTEIGDVFNDLNDLNARDGGAESTEFNANGRLAGTGTRKSARNGRATLAAQRLAQVEIDETGRIEKPRPLATWNDDAQPSVANCGAFARLGNPVATRVPTTVEAQNLAEIERRASGTGVLSVGAIERRDGAKRGVVPAAFRQNADNGENSEVEENGKGKEDGGNRRNGENGGNGGDAENGRVEKEARTPANETIRENGTSGRLGTVAQDAKKSETAKTGETKVEKKEFDDKNRRNGEKRNGENEERVRFRVRSLAVRVGAPRGYVWRVAQNLKAENAVETFANDETAGNWNALYRTTEQKIIAETKNVALLLLRPLAERNGWSENELARSVAVDVFADPNDFDERFRGASASTLLRNDESKNDAETDVENRPNGPFEVVANFANTAELIAEETTSVESTADEEKETTSETTDEETATDFWAVWATRARRLDAKTKVVGATGVGILTILTLAAGATATRRRKKTGRRFEEEEESEREEENETRENDAIRTVARNESKKKNAAQAKNKKDGKDGRDGRGLPAAEKRTNSQKSREKESRQEQEVRRFGRDLSVARFEEKKTFAQNAGIAGIAENGEETRTEASAANARNERNGQDAQIRRFVSAAQTSVGVDGRSERGKLAKFEKIGENLGDCDDRKVFGDFDDFDDWDELDDDLLEIRSLIERERARVGDETTAAGESSETAKSEKRDGDATRRRAALDLVARNPERAAASLQRWLRPGA